MKKYLILFIAMVSTSIFVGCDSDDNKELNYVTYEAPQLSLSVNQYGSSTLEVDVYTANIVGADRTFNINVEESSSLEAESYSVPASVTVPANSNRATFNVEVSDNNLDDSGGTLVLSLEGQDVHVGAPVSINVVKVCEFDPAGNFTNNSEFSGGSYDVVIEEGSSSGEYVAKDLFADGSDIIFTVNDDFSVTIPSQEAWVHADYGQASVVGRAGSRVNPCTGQITLVMEHTVSAGTFGAMTEVLTKE